MAQSHSIDITAALPASYLSFSPVTPSTPSTIIITPPPSATIPPTHYATERQWVVLKHVCTLPLSQMRSVTTEWISSFDRPLLLALSIKMNEERDLLKANLTHTETLAQHKRDRVQASSSMDCPLSPGTCPVGIRARDSMLPPVGRRRSSILPPISPIFPMFHTEDEEERELKKTGAELRNKRVMFEAGWCWIEGHLDFYADLFGENEVERGRRKDVLWEEVLRAREECEGLVGRLGEEFGEVVW